MSADEAVESAVLDYNPLMPGVPLSHIEDVDRLRSQHRSFRSSLAQGFWVLTEGADIRAALQDPGTFSSAAIVPTDPDPQYLLVPEMLDPPQHTSWRQLLAPWFSPRAVEKMSDAVRRRCVELIEPIAAGEGCDFHLDFAYRYPTSIFLELMGLPTEDLALFQHWNDEIHHLPFDVDPQRERSLAAQNAVKSYFADLMEVRRSEPSTTSSARRCRGRSLASRWPSTTCCRCTCSCSRPGWIRSPASSPTRSGISPPTPSIADASRRTLRSYRPRWKNSSVSTPSSHPVAGSPATSTTPSAP